MLRCYSSPYTSELKTFIIEDADLDVAKLKTDLYLVDNGYKLDLVEPKGERKMKLEEWKIQDFESSWCDAL